MDNIIRMSLEDLLGSNSYFRPFDVAALTEVSATEEGKAVLRELMQLYMSVSHEHKREIDGISLLGEECLIPLTARAWLDFTRRQKAGERIDSKDIRKHRND